MMPSCCKNTFNPFFEQAGINISQAGISTVVAKLNIIKGRLKHFIVPTFNTNDVVMMPACRPT